MQDFFRADIGYGKPHGSFTIIYYSYLSLYTIHTYSYNYIN